MSFTTSAFRFALSAAALCAAVSTADARPRRVVVLDFDGPRQLADVGRSSVLSALGNQYDVIATKRWEQAREVAAQQAHGPAQWQRASKQSGVEAVIDGWVQDEGRRKILNIVVRDSSNGHEFDTISVRLDAKNGISTESSRQLQTSLDEVLDWINTGRNDPPPGLPSVDARKLGPSKPPADDDAPRVRGHRAPIEDDVPVVSDRKSRRTGGDRVDGRVDGRVEADDPDRSARSTRATKADKVDPDRTDRTDKPAAEPATEPAHDARPVEVSTAATDPEIHDIEILFPPGADEREKVLGPRAVHVPQKTARIMVDGGLFIDSRSLIWNAAPDANVTQFAGVSTRGFQVNASVYPFPTKQIDGVLSGVGFTASLHHSAGSSVEFDNVDAIEEYVINQNGWELGVHYRAPLNSLVTVDGGAFYGNQTFEIVDASPDFEVPDTKYSYLGATAHLDLAITDRATIGFGARYFTVLDAGDLASVDWFGPVGATGIGLEGTFMIPLPSNLYVRGQLSYQRISLETSGGGQITDDEGVTGGTDSLISGNVNIGIAF